jgi:hypothetical protein
MPPLYPIYDKELRNYLFFVAYTQCRNNFFVNKIWRSILQLNKAGSVPLPYSMGDLKN